MVGKENTEIFCSKFCKFCSKMEFLQRCQQDPSSQYGPPLRDLPSKISSPQIQLGALEKPNKPNGGDLWRSLECLKKPSTAISAISYGFHMFSLSSWETMGNWDHRFVVSNIEVLLKYYWSHVHPWVDGPQWQSYFAYLQSGFFRWQSWRRKRCATRSWMRQGFSMIFSSRSSYSMLLVNVQLVCKGCVYFCVFTPTSGCLFCHAPCGSYGSCGSCNEH